jgi:hypothetical protein
MVTNRVRGKGGKDSAQITAQRRGAKCLAGHKNEGSYLLIKNTK